MTCPSLSVVNCPYCNSERAEPWANERGYVLVRCRACDFLYVNPAPSPLSISEAVRTGVHTSAAGHLDVRSRRVASKVAHYQRLFLELFPDLWARSKPIHWLDVGAGYGEVLEAVNRLAPPGSIVEGLEPMEPKATAARARGLTVIQDYLRREHGPVDVISSIDVFSHLPDYRSFLADVVAVLNPRGEMVIVTGNLADLNERKEFPGQLGLPDHLIFGGQKHLVGYLTEVGFEIVQIRATRIDGIVNFAKLIVKRLIGRPVVLRIPYTSAYRQLTIRARLNG